MEVVVNGRFLSQPQSGVQRFAWQLVRAIDTHLSSINNSKLSVKLALPRLFSDALLLKSIEPVVLSESWPKTGHIWDQIMPMYFSNDAVDVHLTNGGPALRQRGVSVIHDAAIYRTPGNYSRKYVLAHKALELILSKRRRIYTVSEFSRGELSMFLNTPPDQISVIPNGGDHILSYAESGAGLEFIAPEKLSNAIVVIGSTSPNKNLKRLVSAFEKVNSIDKNLIIVGGFDDSVFSGSINLSGDSVYMPGRLTDEQIVFLLKRVRCLVFPSIYEGFGIPPLEALYLNCPVLCADIPATREVCGDSVTYFDPHSVESIAAAIQAMYNCSPTILQDRQASAFNRAREFTWHRSAAKLLNNIESDFGV